MKTIKNILIESSQIDRFAKVRNNGKRSKEEERKVAKASDFFFNYRFNGWKFTPTIHGAAQAFDRRPDLNQKAWKDFHQRVFDKLEKMKKINNDFVFYSKKYQQAYVAAVNFDSQEVRIITVLPKKKSKPKEKTIRMIIESIEYELEWIDCE